MFTIEDRIKRVMVLTMLADGEIGESEIAIIRDRYRELTGTVLRPDQIEREAQYAREDGQDVTDYLRALGRSIDDEDRRTIVRAVHAVANADGWIAAQESKLVTDVARALDMSDSELHAALSGT